jgi:RHS repeat-associated protein
VDVTGNNTTTEILNEYHYYPFGMNMAYDWTNNVTIDNKYQYNGKEVNDDFGLNLNDYGARWYDAALGRWWAVDPVDDFGRQPYGYANNNPINNIDFMGMMSLAAETAPLNNQFGVGTLGNFDAIRNDRQSTPDGWIIRNGTRLWDPNVNSQQDADLMYPGFKYIGDTDYYISEDGVHYFDQLGNMMDAFPIEVVEVVGRSSEMEAWYLGVRLAKEYGMMAAMPGGLAGGGRLSKLAKMGRTTKSASAAKALVDQASDLVKLNGGKNSITIQTPTKQIRFDLAGRAHGGVPTPHKQIYNKNFLNGQVRSISRASKEAIPMTQAELKMIRKYLEKK